MFLNYYLFRVLELQQHSMRGHLELPAICNDLTADSLSHDCSLTAGHVTRRDSTLNEKVKMTLQATSLQLKGGYVHFNMYIFHFWSIDLDFWNAFCEVSPW